MNTEEFTKATLQRDDDEPVIKAPSNDESSDYVVKQNSTISKIFAILAIVFAIVIWIYAVNASVESQTITVTAADVQLDEKYANYTFTPVTFDIKGRKTYLERKAFTAEDFVFEIVITETASGEIEGEIKVDLPNKTFLANDTPIKVVLTTDEDPTTQSTK